MGEKKKSNCEDCTIRRKAEARPSSLIGILWKLHTYICPGWRKYQRSLAEEGGG